MVRQAKLARNVQLAAFRWARSPVIVTMPTTPLGFLGEETDPMKTLHGTVLLVEDEDTLRGLVADFLRGASYRVIEAADGPEGVERFSDSGPIDLAILDLNLPGLSGVEVCRRIRTLAPEQNVLICSAAIMPDAECALRDMGVSDHLMKPYHPDVLLAYVARLSARASAWQRVPRHSKAS